MSDNAFLIDVIDTINKALTVCDRPPLKTLLCGIPFDARLCPLAEALGATVTYTFARFDDEVMASKIAVAWGTLKQSSHEVTLPYFLQRFVRLVDLGEFPELMCGTEALQEQIWECLISLAGHP